MQKFHWIGRSKWQTACGMRTITATRFTQTAFAERPEDVTCVKCAAKIAQEASRRASLTRKER